MPGGAATSEADDEPQDDSGRSRLRVGVGAAIVLLIVAGVIAVLVSAGAQRGSTVAVAAASGLPRSTLSTGAPSASAPTTPGAVLVHVTGAVRKPGLVSLSTGARVVDAVAAAGGLTEDADPARINLARPVTDGEQLAVPRVGEAAPAAAPGTAGDAAGGGTAVGAAPGAAGAVVNLNTASQAELETLPRIGPALAQRILDYRQSNGRFAQPTDLLKVSGIGQKLFDGLKDRVTV